LYIVRIEKVASSSYGICMKPVHNPAACKQCYESELLELKKPYIKFIVYNYISLRIFFSKIIYINAYHT
jgi:hypothetical protein